MNTLSWMLYLAGVAGALGGWLTFLGIVALLGHPVLAFFATFDAYGDPHISQMQVKWRVIAFGAALCLLATLIPGKNTVYAIAASEMGERALTSPIGGKAAKALDAWLDRQIAGDDKDEKHD